MACSLALDLSSESRTICIGSTGALVCTATFSRTRKKLELRATAEQSAVLLLIPTPWNTTSPVGAPLRRTIEHFRELLRLRVRAELHQADSTNVVKRNSVIDEDAYAVLSSAVDDAWSDVCDAHPDPFLDKKQARLLIRALPWLAIERAVTSYMGFVADMIKLDSRGVFASSANRRR
jgi:hypothetical protein